MGQSQSKDNTETWDGTGKQLKKGSLTLMLLGKTGHGKSSLGNCILGCEVFKVGNDTSSQTAEVVCAVSNSEGCSLKVVDGAGLQDTELSELEDTERADHNVRAALTMCYEGVDAFLIVFRFDTRFTEEEVSVLETLTAIFGQDYLKHAIVVFTHGDLFDKEEIAFDDWCKKQTGPFKELYNACYGRCVLFNNNERDEEKQMAQREQLTQLVYDLKQRHGCYTVDCFKLAASERQRMIITMKGPILKAYIQKQASILSSEILKYYKRPCARQKAEIERVIHKLKNELQTEDKGQGLLKDLMNTVEDVERNLHDVIEVQALCAKLENIMKAEDMWSQTAFSGYLTGFLVSLAFPPAIGPIFLGCTVANIIGKGVITIVGKTTVTKIKTKMFNIQYRHQKLQKN